MIVLYLESFENKLFEPKKHVCSMVKPSQEDESLCTVMNCFSRFLLLSIYKNTSESIRPCFQNNPTQVNNLKSDVSLAP